MKKSIEDYWKALDLVHPKHRMSGQWHEMWKNRKAYCTDDSPSGHGNFGCKRCEAIIVLEERGIKIWPRNKKVKRCMYPTKPYEGSRYERQTGNKDA